MKIKPLSFIFISAIAFLTLILHIFFREHLFEYSLGFQHSMQQGMDSSFLRFFLNIIANFVNPNIVAGLLIVLYAMITEKLAVLNFLFYFTLITFLNSVLKALFADPRPFWVDTQVDEWEWVCYMEYGNPSGHAFLSPLLYEWVLIYIIYEKFQVTQRFWRAFWASLTILLVVLICFCRLYLGIYSGIAYRFYGQRIIEKMFESFLAANTNNLYFRKKILLLYILLTTFLVIFIPMLIYFLQSAFLHQPDLTIWQHHIMQKCNIHAKIIVTSAIAQPNAVGGGPAKIHVTPSPTIKFTMMRITPSPSPKEK